MADTLSSSAKVDMVVSEYNLKTRDSPKRNPKGIPTRTMENVKWYSSSQVSTAKHVSYPQLTATGVKHDQTV